MEGGFFLLSERYGGHNRSSEPFPQTAPSSKKQSFLSDPSFKSKCYITHKAMVSNENVIPKNYKSLFQR